MRVAVVWCDAALPVHLRVQALIDGRSQLVMSGPSVHWMHYEYAAPGRWSGAYQPTMLDAVGWLPDWPDVPTAENRNCLCSSSTTALPLPLPAVPAIATITPVMVRSAATVVQQPAAANAFTTIIELDDTAISAADTYVIDVDIVPE